MGYVWDMSSATEVFWHSGALQIGLLLLLLYYMSMASTSQQSCV